LITGGWECEVYSFLLEGHEAGQRKQDELILRLYPMDGAASKAKAEFCVMRQLRQVDYPVPRVHALAVENSTLGKPFVIMEKIGGKVLASMIRRPSGRLRSDLHHLFCKLLAELHSLDWRAAFPDIAHYQAQGLVSRWIAKVRAVIGQFQVTDYDEVLDWLQARQSAVKPYEASVVHLDFHPENVLIRADGAPFVIDWTQADISDRRFDLAWTLLLISESSGPAPRDQVLAEYERITGALVEDLEIFEVAAALKRLASITISLAVGSEKIGMRPGVEAQMVQHADHLQTAYAVLRDRTDLNIPAIDSLLRKLSRRSRRSAKSTRKKLK